jgi:hypothetical protein
MTMAELNDAIRGAAKQLIESAMGATDRCSDCHGAMMLHCGDEPEDCSPCLDLVSAAYGLGEAIRQADEDVRRGLE